jgi:hypothetical protein
MVDISHIAFQNPCVLHRWAPVVRVSDGVWTLLNKGKKVSLDTRIYDMPFMSCMPVAQIRINIPEDLSGRAYQFFISNRKVTFARYSIVLDYPEWIFCLQDETEQVVNNLKKVYSDHSEMRAESKVVIVSHQERG